MKAKDIISDVSASDSDIILEIASLFVGPFSLDWLVELTGMRASSILVILERHTQSGTLFSIKPAIYQFNDLALEHWANRLSAEQKGRFHQQITYILIRDLTENDEKPIIVATHLLQITVDIEACHWLMRAGVLHAKAHQANKAIACFHHILSQLSPRNGMEEDRLFIQAAIAHDNNYAGRTDIKLYRGFIEDAQKRARKRNWEDYVLLLEMHIARYERLNADFNSAISRFNKAYERLSNSQNSSLRSVISVTQSYFLFWQGRFQDTIEYFEQSVPDVYKVPFGYFPLLANTMVGHCYTIIGQVSQGLGMLDDLRELCLKRGDTYLLAHINSTFAMVFLSINRFDEANHYLKLASRQAKKEKNIWVITLATCLKALVCYHKGDIKKSEYYLRQFSQISADTKRNNLLLFPYLIEICWAMETGDMKKLKGFSLTEEIDYLLELDNTFLKGLAYRYKALITAKQKGWNSGVTSLYSRSIKYLEKSGNQIEVVKTRLCLLRYYLTSGHQKKAETMIIEIADTLVANEYDLTPDDLKPLFNREAPQKFILSEILGLTSRISGQGSNNKLLYNIITTANKITGAERGALLMVDETQPIGLKIRASKNITMEQIQDPAFSDSLKIIRNSIATQKGIIYETSHSDESITSQEGTIQSCLCVPVILGEKSVGVLYHDNRVLSNVFKPFGKQLLEFFTAIAALDLDRETKQCQLEQAYDKTKSTKKHSPLKTVNKPHTDGMIGESAAFKRVLTRVGNIAPTDASVLITGETGVGKNVLARAIHNQSARKDGPFITVQCSALTEGLITSELFGHEKGAFTGATNRRVGRFELANGGTLFLDEIGDLSLDVQSRLLRVLQSKEFERVGGGKDVLISDFRLIAATNKDLELEIKEKRFREDLFYRINVYPIIIPPLRERKKDIPLLCDHFIRSLSTRHDMDLTTVSPEMMKTLLNYDWPGNIREFENVLQRTILADDTSVIAIKPNSMAPQAAPRPTGFDSLEENEKRHIVAVLSYTRGKVHGPGGAAELLKINSSTLDSRIKKLKIDKMSFKKPGFSF